MGGLSDFLVNAAIAKVPVFKTPTVAPAGVKSDRGPVWLPKLDSRVLVDIGVDLKLSKNLWTGLPGSWVLTSATGTLADATGFIPGANGGNAGAGGASNTGRIQSPAAFNTTAGAQGTVMVKVARTGVSVNGNDGGASANNTATSWWDSAGNANGANGGSYPPAVWTLSSNTGTRNISLLVNQAYALIEDHNGSFQYIQFSLLNPSQSSPNIDPNFVEIMFSWSGANFTLFVDGIMIRSGTLTAGAPPAQLFANVAIGNYVSAPNATLGGCLGPHKIERFQLHTGYIQPVSTNLLISIGGDSYVVGGFGAANPPAGDVATIADINGVQSMMNAATPIFSDNAGSTNTQVMLWVRLLQSYGVRQLGVLLPYFMSACSGRTTAFTTYGNASNSVLSYPNNATPFTTYDDAVIAARPAIACLLDSVNNLLNTNAASYVNTTPVEDYKWRFDYWARENPNLRAIVLIEQMSMEKIAGTGSWNNGTWTAATIATAAAALRNLMRAAFLGTTYYADGRVPVYYVPTFEYMAGAPDAEAKKYLWGSDPRVTVTTGSTPHGPNRVRLAVTGASLSAGECTLTFASQTGVPAINQGQLALVEGIGGADAALYNGERTITGGSAATIKFATAAVASPTFDGTTFVSATFSADIHLTIRGRIKLADLVWAKLKDIIKTLLSTNALDTDIPYDGGTPTGGAITPNLAFSTVQTYASATSATTVNAPLNAPRNGARLRLRLNATGTIASVTFNAKYRNPPGALSATAGQTWYGEFECVDQVTNTWQFVGGSTAFA